MKDRGCSRDREIPILELLFTGHAGKTLQHFNTNDIGKPCSRCLFDLTPVLGCDYLGQRGLPHVRGHQRQGRLVYVEQIVSM